MSQARRYICLIRREEFNDILRFGKVSIRPNSVLMVDSDFEHLKGESDSYLKSLANISNRFDESSSYIGVYFEKDLPYKEEVDVYDVKRIFALDDQSYNDFSLSFDRKVNLLRPLWDDMFSRIQIEQEVCSRREGCRILWELYRIEFPMDEIENLVSDEAIREFIEVSYNGTLFGQPRSLLTHLLKYTKHGFYGKKNVGFFKDAVNIFLNCKIMQEVIEEEVCKTNIFQKLNSICDDEVFGEIYSQIQDSEFVAQYNDPTFDNFLLVSVLFLKFKNLYSIKSLNKKMIDASLDNYGKPAAEALYLLGIWLGPNKQVPALLETHQPEFFKSECQMRCLETQEKEARMKAKREMELMEHRRGVGAEGRQRSNGIRKSSGYVSVRYKHPSLFDNNADTHRNFPITMVKYTKAGIPAKNCKPKPARTQEEFDELSNKGYRPTEN